MAILWPQSLVPWLNPNGDPYSGAMAYFFDAGTTTPKTTYSESGLGEANEHPVVANASGRFGAIFLTGGDYRVRITDADGVVIEDIDGISIPIFTETGGGGGDTPTELLARTGDYKFRHDTGAHTGWVRAAGRTIGSATSGASERANADCEALFLLLWTADTTLSVSGGRGATAAGDWAAAKTIALPDLRLRGLIGMASMGATLSTLIAAAAFDNSENGDTLGATVGAGSVILTEAQLAAHDHAITIEIEGDHNHLPSGGGVFVAMGGSGPVAGIAAGASPLFTQAAVAATAGDHNHPADIADAGGGQAHPNVQPSAVATCYLKL